MMGTRWMTTFRKLPTRSPSNDTRAMYSGGEPSRASALTRPSLDPRTSDDLTELEDRQVHGDHEAADEHAENAHDQRFEQARHGVDGVVDLGFVERGDLAGHFVERAGFFADGDHLYDHVG